MKKKILHAGVIVALLATIILIGISHLEKTDEIARQQSHIAELKVITEQETEKVENLEEQNTALTADLASARRGIDTAEAEIERTNSEIRQVEIEKAEQEKSASTGRKIRVKVTGYCSCSLCCGEWAYKNPGVTASGTVAKFGTIAAPPSLPFGTKMMIEGYGDQVFTVEDTGSAVVYSDGTYVIDMWMPTHEQAYAVGNRVVYATILE